MTVILIVVLYFLCAHIVIIMIAVVAAFACVLYLLHHVMITCTLVATVVLNVCADHSLPACEATSWQRE
jgi:hypothetical protein